MRLSQILKHKESDIEVVEQLKLLVVQINNTLFITKRAYKKLWMLIYIERVQKCALSLILGKKYINYDNALAILQLEKLCDRREALF